MARQLGFNVSTEVTRIIYDLIALYLAGEPKRMWVIEAANHRFSDTSDELEQRVLEAIAWVTSLSDR